MSQPWDHLTIKYSGPPLTAAAIQAAEAKVRLLFPPEYVEFLLGHNGGSFRPWPSYPIEGCPRDTAGLLQCFFNIGAKESTDLVGQYQTHSQRIPPDLLPIASDPGGNLICLACKGEKAGRVFFWERAYEANTDEGEEVGWRNVFAIAESFPAFLRGLQVRT